MINRAQRFSVIFLVFGLFLVFGASSSRAQGNKSLVGIWLYYAKGKMVGGSAFFAGGKGVLFDTQNATVAFRWSRSGNRLTFTTGGPSRTYTAAFSVHQRVVSGRKVRVRRVRWRDAGGSEYNLISARFGLNGRLVGSYCTHVGFSSSNYGRFASLSKTIRYRFDGRGGVQYATRSFAYSSLRSGGQFSGYVKGRGTGRYIVAGGQAFIMWSNGTADQLSLSRRSTSGRASSFTIGPRPYGPGLCN